MALQLPHLAVHCQEAWLKRLRAPARRRLAIGDRFMMSYFPRPPRRGAGAAAIHPETAAHPGTGRPLVVPQAHQGQGQGRSMVGARCLEHRAPFCDRCRRMRYGINRCCRAGHVGLERCGAATVACPPVQTRWGPGQRVVTLIRREGARALLAWLYQARPASEARPPPERPVTPAVRRRLGCWASAPHRPKCTQRSPPDDGHAHTPAKPRVRTKGVLILPRRRHLQCTLRRALWVIILEQEAI